MITFDVELTGVSPLLLNRFTDAAALDATNGVRSSVNARDRGSEYEQAEEKLYKDDNGVIVIPAMNLHRCIVDGGKFHKQGKKQVTTAKESLLYSASFINVLYIPIQHTAPWQVDVKPIVIPSTGGRMLRYRPRFDDWKLRFRLDMDERLITETLMRMIVDDAGNRIGLGDFRPARKGPHGRFVVTLWQRV